MVFRTETNPALGLKNPVLRSEVRILKVRISKRSGFLGPKNPVLGQGQVRIVFSAGKQSGPRTDFSSPRAGLDCVRAGPGPVFGLGQKRSERIGLTKVSPKSKVRIFRSEVRIFRTGKSVLK